MTGEATTPPDSAIDSFLGKVAAMPAEAPPAPTPPLEGRRIGRYLVGEKLGQGGMGQVHTARDEQLGRTVALKTLHAGVLHDARRRARFLREARSASRLTHPGIATVFEAGEDDGVLFIAMEHVRGATLRAVVEAHPEGLPAGRVAALAEQIAEALGAAHDAGLVHRDLKPENVVVTPEDRTKVLDFGLAKQLDGQGSEAALATAERLLTQEGQVLGTPSYMAPEQAAGEGVGPTADVFSFGVVLYELLSGRRPFDAASTVATLVAVSRDAPPPLRLRGLAAALARVALRSLAKDPARRYADGRALHQALVAARTGRRSPTRVGLVALGIAALAATGVGLYARGTRSAASSEVSEEPPKEADVTARTATVTPPSSASLPAPTVAPAAAAPSSMGTTTPKATKKGPRAESSAKSTDDPLAEQK